MLMSLGVPHASPPTSSTTSSSSGSGFQSRNTSESPTAYSIPRHPHAPATHALDHNVGDPTQEGGSGVSPMRDRFPRTPRQAIQRSASRRCGLQLITPGFDYQALVMDAIYGERGIKAGFTRGVCREQCRGYWRSVTCLRLLPTGSPWLLPRRALRAVVSASRPELLTADKNFLWAPLENFQPEPT